MSNKAFLRFKNRKFRAIFIDNEMDLNWLNETKMFSLISFFIHTGTDPNDKGPVEQWNRSARILTIKNSNFAI